MSELSSKLEYVRPSIGGRAQDSGTHLLTRWGSRRVDARTIYVDTMGGREVWRRVEGGRELYEQEVRS